MPDSTISSLFISLSQDDRQAYEGLFTYYYNRIYSTALQFCKVQALAEDIAQESLLTLWEKRKGIADIKDPEAWLFTVARNRAKNIVRDNMVNDRYLKYARELLLQEQNTPESLLIARQKATLLRQSLDELTNKQKHIYYLSRHEGLTYEEIAVRLGLGKETVKEHIAKALSRIKSFIARHKKEMAIFWAIIFS